MAPVAEFTDADSDALAGDMTALVATVTSLDTTVERAVTYLYAQGQLDHLAETLDILRTWRKRLAAVEARVEQRTAQLGRDQGLLRKGALLPDGRRVEFKGGADRRDWQVDDVLRDVTRASLERIGVSAQSDVVATDTGESRPLPEVVGELRDDLVAVLPNGTNSLRTTRLKALGLTPGDYCTTTAGRRTVHIAEAADVHPMPQPRTA